MSSLLRNQKVRDALLQALFVGALGLLAISGAVIARQNIVAQGIASGFDFLFKSTGWNVSFSLVPVTADDPYWWYFVVGILNTLFLGSFGLIFATLVGMTVGLARASGNDMAGLLGRAYVDVFRNIPLILQVFFWYAVFTHLPVPRNAQQVGGIALTNRGFYVPVPNVGAAEFALATLTAVAAIVFLVWSGRTRHLSRPIGDRRPIQLLAAAIALTIILALLFAGHEQNTPAFDIPVLQGLNLHGGLRIPTEFSALVVAIAIYGGAYVGEIVRGGFLAVSKGQVEAAESLGLTAWQVFTRVRLPLALRAMMPILANQYVWLMKATTMGIAVGFNDFFMMVALTINHSGQTLEAIGILMAGFLTINLSLAAVFNRINAAIALRGNQLRA
jgi:general L-amino acid transport system permease protein